MVRIAVIGLGLIGGSFALALKRARPNEFEIAGCASTSTTIGKARKRGAIDIEARTPADAVQDAAVVFIATPILQIRRVFEEIAPALATGAVVTDAASTKRDVMAWANELLPDTVHFVGGHPVAGKEESGIDVAEAELFDGRPWAITPPIRASDQAVRTVEGMVALIGGVPLTIDAEEHDSYLAAVSHLPLFASVALFSLARESQAWRDLAVLAGSGFRGATRLASTSPDLGNDITLTNRDNVVHWLDRYIEELRRIRDLVADEKAQEELLKTLVTAQTERDVFVQTPQERREPRPEGELPSPGEMMRTMLVGEYLSNKRKESKDAFDSDDRRIR